MSDTPAVKIGDHVEHATALPGEDCHDGTVLDDLGDGYLLVRWESGRKVACSAQRLVVKDA